MCGISGFINLKRNQPDDQLTAIAKSMADRLTNRGPDDGATWVDAAAGLGFGHRRLSIVDLSTAGHQPMTSSNGRFVVVYNGEIYNAREVAQELAGHQWRGHSDTEVLIEACAKWGVESATQRFIGMFAFALWDKAERKVFLVRDRIGIKPLYYGRQDGTFLFASELKAIRAYPGFKGTVSDRAVASYMRLGYVPAPLSIYRDIAKLPPAHILELDADGNERLVCYWNAREKAVEGQAHLDPRPVEEIVSDVKSLLADAVARRMIADVPIGAFLSGGIDSSLVVAMMQAQSSRPVQTFTIGFRERKFNEAERARAIAQHLGTDHTELIVDPDEARAVIPLLPDMYDEPFADYSQIPTYLVSKLARGKVTVSLSGDGGDEIFGGYTRYLAIERIWKATGFLPASLRTVAGRALRAIPPDVYDLAANLVPRTMRPSQPGYKVHKGADILSQASPDAMYGNLVSLMPGAARAQDDHNYPWLDPTLATDIPDLISRLRMMDIMTYLPGDILDKLDRATMAVGLEGRIPLLDHRLVELSWTLPRDLLIHHGKGKWILRKILSGYLPDTLMQQPKMGFTVPLGDWLRGPLRDWAEDLLSEHSLATRGLIDPAPIRKMWKAHLAGRVNCPHHLWTVLMLQAWWKRWA